MNQPAPHRARGGGFVHSLRRAALLTLPLALAAWTAAPDARRTPADGRTAASHPAAASQAVLAFEVTLDPALVERPYSGRVWVMTSPGRRVRSSPDWFNPSPFFTLEVKDWKPGEPLLVDERARSHPKPISAVAGTGLRAQAFVQLSVDAREAGDPGNGRSAAVSIDPADRSAGPVRLTISERIADRPFRGTDRIRPFDIPSRLLKAFHGREVLLTGAVILPPEYATQPQRRFPALYVFPGFGQTRRTAPMYARASGEGEVPMVQVLLDAECPTGFHEYADSANNGPYGQALVEELIPHLEKEYRLIPEPTARFVTGHSSGGWASLWVQVTYPDYFGGAWPTAPDPVDFRDFTGIDIYAKDVNAFRTPDGQRRPLARGGGKVLLYFQDFSDMEAAYGPGGQLNSFEAVFSPRGPDGQPMRLWDRRTGRIDPAVAKAWEKYDIRLVLERNWKTLGPKLRGKLHILVGQEDTFYLDGAVRLLKESLERLGSDADVRILPGYDHGTLLLSPEMQGIRRAVSRQFLKHHAGEADR